MLIDIDNLKYILKDLKPDHYTRTLRFRFPDIYENILKETAFLDKFNKVSLSERLYCLYNNLKDRKKCNCGKYTLFLSLSDGYREYCCNRCINYYFRYKFDVRINNIINSKDWNIFYKLIEINIYENFIKFKHIECDTVIMRLIKDFININSRCTNKKCTNKRKSILFNSFDSDFWEKREQKSKKTKLKKYGSPTYNNSNKMLETKSKVGKDGLTGFKRNGKNISKTLRSRSIEEWNNSVSKQKRSKLNNIDENGLNSYDRQRNKLSENHMNRTDIDKNKINIKVKQTSLKNWGVEYYLQSKDCKEKTLKALGVENVSQTKDWKNLWKDKDWLKKKQEKEYNTKKKITLLNQVKRNKSY